MVRGIANSKIGFGDLILLLRYFFKLKVSTHPIEPKISLFKDKAISKDKAGCQEKISPAEIAFELFSFEKANL